MAGLICYNRLTDDIPIQEDVSMKCKVCGKRFKAIAENKYIAIEKIGALEGLTKAPKIF